MSDNPTRNGSGYYDPTAAEMFKRERKRKKQRRRDKEVRTIISQSLSILSCNDLHLMNRMVIKDERTGEVYK